MGAGTAGGWGQRFSLSWGSRAVGFGVVALGIPVGVVETGEDIVQAVWWMDSAAGAVAFSWGS